MPSLSIREGFTYIIFYYVCKRNNKGEMKMHTSQHFCVGEITPERIRINETNEIKDCLEIKVNGEWYPLDSNFTTQALYESFLNKVVGNYLILTTRPMIYVGDFPHYSLLINKTVFNTLKSIAPRNTVFPVSFFFYNEKNEIVENLSWMDFATPLLKYVIFRLLYYYC